MAKKATVGPNKKKFQHNVDDDGEFTRKRMEMTPEERRADNERIDREIEEARRAREGAGVTNEDTDPIELEDFERHGFGAGGEGRSRTSAPATEKQLAFLRDLGWTGEPEVRTKMGASDLIEKLLAKKSETPRTDIPAGTMPNRYPGTCRKCGGTVEPGAGNVTKDATNRWVTAHNECPEQKTNPRTGTTHAASEPPEGIHFFQGQVYKVQVAVHGSKKLYAKVLLTSTGREMEDAAERWEYVGRSGVFHKLSEATLMTKEQAAEFGKLYGMCCVCARTLTDETSIEHGIGPVCEGRLR